MSTRVSIGVEHVVSPVGEVLARGSRHLFCALLDRLLHLVVGEDGHLDRRVQAEPKQVENVVVVALTDVCVQK